MSLASQKPQHKMDDALKHALLDKIVESLRSAKWVQIIGHLRPDGDCIGSMLAMAQILDYWEIKYALCAQLIPESAYAELPHFSEIKPLPDSAHHPDVILYLDCATSERGPEVWNNEIAPSVINIDHHTSNTLFGTINWVDPSCAATGEMIEQFIQHAGIPLTPLLAELLLLALVTDTGSFRFSNTGAQQHLTAARLLEAGAKTERIDRLAFGGLAPESLLLTGAMLSAVRVECEGQLIWSEIREDLCRKLGGEGIVPENLSNHLRCVKGAVLALLFHELEGGFIRVSFRSFAFGDKTANEIDVSELAAKWGGGGHPRASGLRIKTENYEADRNCILESTKKIFEHCENK